MSASLARRMTRWALRLTPWLLAALLGAGWFLTSWTPGYLEKLVPELAQDMGLPLTEFHIRRAGLFSADIGPVRLGEATNGLTLNNVRVEYTPASLKQKRVTAVIIQGLRLHCSYGPQGLRIPVLDALRLQGDDSPEEKKLPLLPFDRLELRHSLLDATVNDIPLAVPVEAFAEPKENTVPFKLKLRPRDQTIDVDGVYASAPNTLSLQVDSRGLHLGAWADLLPAPVKGAVDLSLRADLALGPAQKLPDSLKARLELSLTAPNLSSLGIPFTDDMALHADMIGSNADFTLSAAGIELTGTLAATQRNGSWQVALKAGSSQKISLPAGDRQATLSGLRLAAKGTTGPTRSEFRIKISTGGVAYGKEHRTGSVRLDMPVRWPAPKKGGKGSLSVADIRTGKHRIGSLRATLRQQGLGASLRGTLSSTLLPGLKISLDGNVAAETRTGALHFKSLYLLTEANDPSRWVSALAGHTVTGNLDMEGDVRFGPDGLDSSASLYMTDGTLTNAEQDFKVSGMLLIFETPDLMELRSAPAQLFAFDELTAGNIGISNGRFSFQLEPNGVILAESGSFEWAGGHVSSRAFRVVPGREEYDVILFCNQLKLSEILAQLGLAKARGEAALSGELPVSWKHGQISFNSGFLHSTPGEGGVIQVEGLQTLLDSIPKGTPQRGQLELAQAAVTDFEYKWVRIKADTVGRDLLIRLSLDGKPRSTLPFVYRKEIGGFMQIEGDMKGSNFQGLRLDVNFSLPLDRILLYKELIKLIE